MKLRYQYRLRPGSHAVTRLRHEYTLTRWVWNECVHQYRSGNRPTAAKLDKLLTAARQSASWLREGSSVVQQQEIRTYATALNHSFQVPGRGRPRYKSAKRNGLVSLNYTRRGFSIIGNRLRLAGGVTLPVVLSRPLPSEPTSVRVYEDAAGWWWASFVVEVEPDKKTHHPSSSSVGIDWGISTTATTTDPDLTLQFRDVAARQARYIKSQQRRMALHRKQRDAAEKKAYDRARKATARAHKRAAWQRKERARKWAQKVATTHRDVAVEAFRPKFMAKSTMARKMHVAAIRSLRDELAYAVSRSGGRMVEVPAPYTTMTCSNCGARAKHRLPLSQREFCCPTCGFECDRDVNAARNVQQWAGFVPTLDDGCQTVSASAATAS